MGFFKFGGRSKYKNKKVFFDGHNFDSKKERDRYEFLKNAQDAGIIEQLELQVKFELIPAVREEYEEQLETKIKVKTRTIQKAITYTCDFRYFNRNTGEWVVEDVKASPAQAALDKTFRIKEKLFRWRFGYGIKRVYNYNENL